MSVFKKKLKILVFPCGSEIGLEIFKSLEFSKDLELYGASSVSDHGRFIYPNYFDKFPDVDSPLFIPFVSKFVKKHCISAIIPAHDSVVVTLAKHSHEISAKIITSPYSTVSLCRSKKLTYERFKKIIKVPKLYSRMDIQGQFPLFLKPDVGQGSKDTHLVTSEEELDFYMKQKNNLLILEYLPGEEFTVECFTDFTGTLKSVCARKRNRVMNGISVNTTPYTDGEIDNIANKINMELKFKGAWFFQIKINKGGQYTLLEVAPRIPGSSGMNRMLGINYTLLSLIDAYDIETIVLKNKFNIEMDRALSSRYISNLMFDAVYVDYDDTLIVKGKVNTKLVSLIYQCINYGISIFLITRHKYTKSSNLHTELRKYRLNTLFDKIINVSPNKQKSDYISNNKSIFIDDSFSERINVSNKLGIPTFDLDAIDCLIK